ncbi:MAG: hypothetical protein K2X98_00495 [Alphaproteobacteria bacterium]|nr:hypothetical protein [Alphaproteobacteria bacterium]
MIAVYVFVSLFIAGLCTMVSAGAPGSSAVVTPSPYSQGVQKAKNEAIIKDYFNSHGKNVGTTEALMNAGESSERSQRLRGVDRIDGVDIENTHTPSKDEAIRSVDDHVRQAQNAVEQDLKQTAIVENVVSNEKNPPAFAKNEAGEPDNVNELVRREEHKRGEDVKRDPIPPEVIRQAMKYSALGGA